MPSVKFQVTYARSNSKDFVWFRNADELKNDVSQNELAEKAKIYWLHSEKLENNGYSSGLKADMQSTEKAIYTSLKKKSITGSTDDEYIKIAYYMIRSHTMFSN